jgi:hypothetical protein
MSVKVKDQRPKVEDEENLLGEDSTSKKELNCKHQKETEVFSGSYNKAYKSYHIPVFSIVLFLSVAMCCLTVIYCI